MKEMLTIKSKYHESGHHGSTEVRQSWVIETDGEQEVVLVHTRTTSDFPTDSVLNRTVDRLTVSVEDLIAFFEKNGTRKSAVPT